MKPIRPKQESVREFANKHWEEGYEEDPVYNHKSNNKKKGNN